MTPDPYPDLTGAELPDTVLGTVSDGVAPKERPALSEADSRLLDALSQPEPAVVTAVEDQLRTVQAAGAARAVAPPGRHSPLAPVFREPTG